MTHDWGLDDYAEEPWQSYSLRQEAMLHYEHCLFLQTGLPFEKFVEHQLSAKPIQLDLLYELHADLQQRLLGLEEHRFDSRKRVLQAILTIYHVDLTPLTPPSQLDIYHLLSPEQALAYIRQKGEILSAEEEQLIREMIQSSTAACTQLDRDIRLTENLLDMLVDWLWAITLIFVRQSQTSEWHPTQDGVARIH